MANRLCSFASICVIFTLAGCGTDEPVKSVPLKLGQVAQWPTQDWTVKRPEEVGMSSAMLEQALTYAFEGIIPPSVRGPDDPEVLEPNPLTQGVVIVRGGAIVAERYGPGADQNSWAASWSSAKSFISALIGILIDQGRIASVDVPMTTFYPEWVGTDKEPIKLRDVLQMQSGLQFREDYFDPTSEMLQMGTSADELTFMIDRSVYAPPGTRWYYSSGDSMLLSGVIQRVTARARSTSAKR